MERRRLGDHLRGLARHRLARIVRDHRSLTPLLVFLAARAGLGAGARVAGWLTATCLLHVQLSLQERPWGPMMAPLAASLWAAIVHVRTGRRRARPLGRRRRRGGRDAPGGMPFLGLAGLAWALAPRDLVGLLRRA